MARGDDAPVFGDFLAQAHAHVAAAVSVQEELPDDARNGVIRELDRLITILARYLGDMTPAGEFPQGAPGHDPAGGTRAALDARIALRRSAQVLHGAAGPLSEEHAAMRIRLPGTWPELLTSWPPAGTCCRPISLTIRPPEPRSAPRRGRE